MFTKSQYVAYKIWSVCGYKRHKDDVISILCKAMLTPLRSCSVEFCGEQKSTNILHRRQGTKLPDIHLILVQEKHRTLQCSSQYTRNYCTSAAKETPNDKHCVSKTSTVASSVGIHSFVRDNTI